MRKLVNGVVRFHENVLPGLRGMFESLANGQKPDALMVACSDSRVAPNLFASTDPGDLFVARNAGNFIPPYLGTAEAHGDSESAAIEIALERLRVKDIIICGHSSCAAMAALLSDDPISPNLKRWIGHGLKAREAFGQGRSYDQNLSGPDQLSQLSVMAQLDNLRTYPQVQDALGAGALRLHGWWFDITTGNVHSFEPDDQRFMVIDAEIGARILARIGD